MLLKAIALMIFDPFKDFPFNKCNSGKIVLIFSAITCFIDFKTYWECVIITQIKSVMILAFRPQKCIKIELLHIQKHNDLQSCTG